MKPAFQLRWHWLRSSAWRGARPRIRYFVSNPEVSSDLIAMLRYGRGPDDPGRALELVDKPFWRIPE
jgi:hypothetical protein